MSNKQNSNSDSLLNNSLSSKKESDFPSYTNEIRLSPSQWFLTIVLMAVLFKLTPVLWEQIEKFEPDDDYRIPYILSDDYWFYGRYSRWTEDKYQVMVVGDSVVWGHYVPPDGSLSHYLNELTGKHIFANMGIDGIHPVAMSGLLEYYGRAISDTKVILSFNPLWMTSQKHDLQTEKEFRFNHPRLVPQFVPEIACYTESVSNKISVLLERNVSLISWASHIRTTYFDKKDLASWAMENPYQCPFGAITLELPQPEETTEQNEPWYSRSEAKHNFPWVSLESSFQWKFFKRTVKNLQKKGNTVFVVIGPFNEHMMNDSSLDTYRNIKAGVEKWLNENKVPYFMPEALPSRLYADASHPIREGYEMLARQILQNEAFKSAILTQEK